MSLGEVDTLNLTFDKLQALFDESQGYYESFLEANNLYKTMREIKKRNFKSIAVVKIPNKKIGYAINDRLMKASNK